MKEQMNSKELKIAAMNWLEAQNKKHNALGLIIIRAYQNKSYNDLVELTAFLLENNLISPAGERVGA